MPYKADVADEEICLLFGSVQPISLITLLRPGMHNIRPAGQMWPAKAFILALRALIYVYLAKKLNLSGSRMCEQHFFGPPLNLSCATLA